MTVQAAALFDPVVGNIGLFDDDAIVMLKLTEPTGVMPSDSKGNLADLAPDAGTTAPTVVSCFTGKGRQFAAASSQALIAVDKPAGNTLLTRDATVQAIIALNNLAGTAGAQSLYFRGVNDTTVSEYYSLGIQLQQNGGDPTAVDTTVLWQDSAGTVHAQAAGTFKYPGDGQFFLFTVTRRWESPTSVVIRVYVNDLLVQETASAFGDIAGGTTGHTTIGGKRTGGAGGVWSAFLNGAIDELRVLPFELSGEEVREIYRRLAVHQPAGVDMFVGLAPPGVPWTKDLGNNIGRHVKAAAQALGLAIASAEELRALWLPDAVPLAGIERWEKICGLSPRPLDTLGTRRARIIAFLSQQGGYSIPAIQTAVAPLFATTTNNVQILQFSPTVTDNFTGTTLAPERWRIGSSPVTWSVAAGELQAAANLGADIRWEPSRAHAHVRMSIGQTGGNFAAACKLSTYWANLPANTIVGLFLYNRRSNNAIWFGVKNVGGTRKLGYQIFANNVMGAFVTLVTPSLDQAYWLQIYKVTSLSLGTASTYRFAWSTTSATAGFATADVDTGITDMEWAGLAATSDDAALSAALLATFDDFTIRSYSSKRAFRWYAYRDPAIGGQGDMIGAQALVQKMKPAHTYAAACESKSVLCDDTRFGLCNRGPMGAL